MPKNNAREDNHVSKALKFINKWPDIKVPQAMLLAGFSAAEARDRAKRMWIYRRIPNNGDSTTMPPPNSINVNIAETPGISTITDTSPPPSTPTLTKKSKTQGHCNSKAVNSQG